MQYVLIGSLTLAVLVGLGHLFIRANPSQLVRALRYLVGAVLLLAGALFAFGGRPGLGLVLLAFGLSAIVRGRIGRFDLGGSSRSAGQVSAVRSRYLDMSLDHDTGAMSGSVLEGEFAGKALDELDPPALIRLHAELAADPDSLALLEAYLDRRIPGWREDFEGDSAARPGSAADSSAMTDEQAYEILGLLPGAGEAEIRAAHRRLMMKVHPDQGGSTFLAAQINEAKDRLLGKHH